MDDYGPFEWLRLYTWEDDQESYEYSGQSEDLVEHIIEVMLEERDMRLMSSETMVHDESGSGYVLFSYPPQFSYVVSTLQHYISYGWVPYGASSLEMKPYETVFSWLRRYTSKGYRPDHFSVLVFGVLDNEANFIPRSCQIVKYLERM